MSGFAEVPRSLTFFRNGCKPSLRQGLFDELKMGMSVMARIRTEIDFRLNVDIWLKRECLAQSKPLNCNEFMAEVRFPPFGDTDPASITMEHPDFDGYAGACSGKVGYLSPHRIAVNQFKVIIRENVKGVSQADYEGTRSSAVADLISHLQEERIQWAESLAIKFLDWLRLRGQTWLGPMGSISYSSSPYASSFDDQTNFYFRRDFGGGYVVPKRPGSADLDLGSFQSLAESLAQAKSFPLPESFLADAEYFVRQGAPSDLQRAVLLAAVACELKVKEALRKKVLPGGEALIEVLISHPRDFSVSAAGLFDEAMKAAVGRSLREDDRDLWKGICGDKDSLFPRRNKIAHAGIVISATAAQESVQLARQVFAWLDGLPLGTTGE